MNCFEVTFSKDLKRSKIWFFCTLVLIFLVKNIFSQELQTHAQTTAASQVCSATCFCDVDGMFIRCIGDGLLRFPVKIPETTLRLELRNYLVKDLHKRDFSSLPAIQELKFQLSRIETIENATFESNVKLEKLDLSQNALTSLNSGIFKGLQFDLKSLDLASNFIDFVEEAFVDLVNLETLNMRDNKLTRLTSKTFLGLYKLQYLNMDANNISSLEVSTFQNLSNLAHLIISNNPIKALASIDFFGSSLQYIDSSNVGFDIVPGSFSKFVRDLRLAKNNLTRIDIKDFENYPQLNLLVLDDNCIRSIENDALVKQTHLMRLWLNGNSLIEVPVNLPLSLLALYMEDNKLTTLPSYSFRGLKSLEQLFLQRNEIQNLSPCAFCDLASLKCLDLQSNQIENLANGVFSNLTQLETLDLSQNNIQIIEPHCFDRLTRLTALLMSSIPTLVNVDESIFDSLKSLLTLEIYDSPLLFQTLINSTRILHGLRKIEELNINHNRILTLRSDFPLFFPDIKVIKMSGNLWHCDRNLKWLSEWIKQSNVQFYNSYSIRCSSPQNVKFKPLMMLVENDFGPTSIPMQTTQPTFSMEDSSSAKDLTSFSRSFSFLTSTDTAFPTKSVIESGLSTAISSSNVLNLTMEITSETNPISFSPDETDSYSKSESRRLATTNRFSPNKALTNLSTLLQTQTRDLPVTKVFQSMKSHKAFLVTEVSQEVSSVSYKHSSNRNSSSISQRSSLFSKKSLVAQQTTDSRTLENPTTVVVSSSLVALCLVLSAVVVIYITYRRRNQQVKQCISHSSSISYYPYKDEVSVVTKTKGTVGLQVNSHQGMENKLYYMMENEISIDASSNSQLKKTTGNI